MDTDATKPDPTAMPTPAPHSQPASAGELIVKAPPAATAEKPVVAVVEDQPEAAPEAEAEPQYCRHCGDEISDADGVCDNCGRLQDSAVCPTCGSVVRLSQLPEDMVPEAHAPKTRKRKAKGE